MKNTFKIATIVILVVSLLATSFNSFLVILEDNTMVTLVEELPDDEPSSEVDNKLLKLIVSDFEGASITHLEQIIDVNFQQTSDYHSILLDGLTPPPKLS